SRTDRSASFQHLRNTRGDMAVESVINLVVSELVGELFSVTGGAGATENTFRIAREPSLNSADSFVNRWLLAPRTPVLSAPLAPATSLYPTTPALPLLPAPGGVNPPIWVYVSDPRPGADHGNAVWPDGVQREW